MTKSFSGLPSISPSSNNEVVYNGPFIGRACALVDYTPSVYNRDALRFNRGDTIDIIAMNPISYFNPSGLWRGRCQGRIGHFKFINVELLPDRHVLRSSEQRKKINDLTKDIDWGANNNLDRSSNSLENLGPGIVQKSGLIV